MFKSWRQYQCTIQSSLVASEVILGRYFGIWILLFCKLTPVENYFFALQFIILGPPTCSKYSDDFTYRNKTSSQYCRIEDT